MSKEIVFAQHKTMRMVERDYGKQKVFAELDLSSLGQSAYFSATIASYYWNGGAWREDSFGANHEVIHELWPEFDKYVRWHGVHVDCGPWYYWENGWYWFEKYLDGGDRGYRQQGKLEHSAEQCLVFTEHTIVWGALPGEIVGGFASDVASIAQRMADLDGSEELLESHWKTGFRLILEDRYKPLMRAFLDDMVELFGLDSVTRAVQHANGLSSRRDNSKPPKGFGGNNE